MLPLSTWLLCHTLRKKEEEGGERAECCLLQFEKLRAEEGGSWVEVPLSLSTCALKQRLFLRQEVVLALGQSRD